MFYRVDMAALAVTKEQCVQYQGLGGRGLSLRIVAEAVNPNTHPLGGENKLALATGLLAGTGAPNAGRLSVSAKSPLTGMVKESNAGGEMGTKLGRLGIRGIIVEGLPPEDTAYVIRVSANGLLIETMPELKGLTISAAVARLQGISGPAAAIGCIGPAGENKMASACIGFTGRDGSPDRQAGRGGLGAVMGSKGLKAIVVDDSGAPGVSFADEAAFRAGAQKLIRVLQARSAAGQTLAGYNGDRPDRLCSAGCMIRCPQGYPAKPDEVAAGGLKKASRRSLGTSLEIDNLDDIVLMNRLCNDYGVDTVEMGDALRVAIEAGIAQSGNSQAAIRLIHEMGKATPLGRILGAGGEAAGKVFGVKWAAAVKKTGAGDEDPAAAALINAAGLCRFAVAAVLENPDALAGIVEMCNARYGWNKTTEEYINMGN
ncbi:Hypothetical protein LUCI_4907 [Lucifera butyrica]|uniref:Aldehyde ferredoxin oxidoreductase N-terminal domain-containing protein n=1 Tax=Lucifera butyrica TaxID=1351585 RepID=A0A498RHP8_9FIRM|nr:aldehyde ferredoxin oxidoreductase N-terminal domain-containing protein [Lucifera butyrica]VBB09612.1 Hypothetical protein LUCI_4907 [Lucifera butyrica]